MAVHRRDEPGESGPPEESAAHRQGRHAATPRPRDPDGHRVWATARVPRQGPADAAHEGTGTSSAAIAALQAPTGYTCPHCGAWVVDTAVHADFHMRLDPSGLAAPDAERIAGGRHRSHAEEIGLLREVFDQDH